MKRHANRTAIMLKKTCRSILLAGLITTSCEEIMDVSFTGDGASNLVVEGSITTRARKHLVMLSYTGDFFNKDEKVMATGAIVTITDGSDTVRLTEEEAGMYYTRRDVYGITGKTYTLNIRLPDGRQFTASDHLSPVTEIDSIRQSQNYNSYSGYGYDVLFYGQESQPAGDYYMYLLYLNNTLYSDTITEVSFASDEFVNGNYISEYPVYRVREEDISKISTWVTLEMHSISKAYYDFMMAVLLETKWRGSPWDGPPANIPGNISNGAAGFFRASAVSRKSRIFMPLPRAN